MKFQPSTKEDIIRVFEKIDNMLSKKSKTIRIKVLGGTSIILLGIRKRATVDIDVAITSNAITFQKICAKMGIAVDIITVASTVDLSHCKSVNVFSGKCLIVDSITPKDLLRLKLERFYKQDPEDIYAIIKHESISFDEFKSIALDMIPDYIGNSRQLILSAQIVVEQIWPDRLDVFKKKIIRTYPR